MATQATLYEEGGRYNKCAQTYKITKRRIVCMKNLKITKRDRGAIARRGIPRQRCAGRLPAPRQSQLTCKSSQRSISVVIVFVIIDFVIGIVVTVVVIDIVIISLTLLS